MANTDPRPRRFGRPALLQLATGGILAVSLWAGARCLSQGWSSDGMPGHGGGVGGPGQMGMGYSDQHFIVMMIPHHQMGVMMASRAQNNSQHQQLRAMQQAMVKAQSQEIEQMTQWYRSW